MLIDDPVKIVAENIDTKAITSNVINITRQQWAEWAYRQKRFEPHQNTECVRVLWSDLSDSTFQSEIINVDLLEVIKPIIDKLEQYFHGKAIRAIIVKLKANSDIAIHTDGGPSLSGLHRCHIPIITNEKVIFFLSGKNSEGKWYHLSVGKAYEINNFGPHGVKNESDQDRVHLIVDILETKTTEEHE
jgi:hypothetical protein